MKRKESLSTKQLEAKKSWWHQTIHTVRRINSPPQIREQLVEKIRKEKRKSHKNPLKGDFVKREALKALENENLTTLSSDYTETLLSDPTVREIYDEALSNTISEDEAVEKLFSDSAGKAFKKYRKDLQAIQRFQPHKEVKGESYRYLQEKYPTIYTPGRVSYSPFQKTELEEIESKNHKEVLSLYSRYFKDGAIPLRKPSSDLNSSTKSVYTIRTPSSKGFSSILGVIRQPSNKSLEDGTPSMRGFELVDLRSSLSDDEATDLGTGRFSRTGISRKNSRRDSNGLKKSIGAKSNFTLALNQLKASPLPVKSQIPFELTTTESVFDTNYRLIPKASNLKKNKSSKRSANRPKLAQMRSITEQIQICTQDSASPRSLMRISLGGNLETPSPRKKKGPSPLFSPKFDTPLVTNKSTRRRKSSSAKSGGGPTPQKSKKALFFTKMEECRKDQTQDPSTQEYMTAFSDLFNRTLSPDDKRRSMANFWTTKKNASRSSCEPLFMNIPDKVSKQELTFNTAPLSKKARTMHYSLKDDVKTSLLSMERMSNGFSDRQPKSSRSSTSYSKLNRILTNTYSPRS